MDRRVGEGLVPPYRYLAGVTLVGTYVLMVVGSYTSAIGAGLACPDWPTCYGVWIPFLHPEIMAAAPYSEWMIFVEWFHRTLAAVMGVVVVVATVVAWRQHRGNRLVTWSITGALVLFPVQAVLGGLTVTRALEPVIVTAHLGGATLIMVLLVTSTVAAWLAETRRPGRHRGAPAA